MVISKAWIINHLLSCSVNSVVIETSLILTDHPPLGPTESLRAWRSPLGKEGPPSVNLRALPGRWRSDLWWSEGPESHHAPSGTAGLELLKTFYPQIP